MSFQNLHKVMKNKLVIKWFLSRTGIWPYLEIARWFPAYLRWLRDGSCGSAPPPIKRIVISAYLRRFQLQRFVETGTHHGDTLAIVANDPRNQCTSIELSPLYAQRARLCFGKYPNVNILEGDSGLLMPQVVKALDKPCLFWLDGHYSAGDTAKGQKNTPISQELAAVFASPIQGHVVLVDDIRLFNGTHDYPFLDALLQSVRETGCYNIEISLDIARFTPCKPAAF